MSKFRVRATRTVLRDPKCNPFLVPIDECGKAVTTTRVWEFEANDEAEVRLLWWEAKARQLENVIGFELGGIERLK